MPYRTIEFANNQLYHAYNRGFCKEAIFKDKFDKGWFAEKAQRYSRQFSVSIESSAILENHYHFLLKGSPGGLQEFISRLQLAYAQHYNKRLNRKGPVFEGRYKAKPIASRIQYLNTLNYVLKNPLKHQMQKCQLRNYPGTEFFNLEIF